MDERTRLDRLIRETEASLIGLQRRLIFTADVIEKPRIKADIENLQARLLDARKRLGTLSQEPMRLGSLEAEHRVGLKATGSFTPPRTKVFISYSHHDREWYNRLREQLGALEGDGLVVAWDDRWIEAGARWREEAELVLAVMKVAVLLVSADYLASDFILHNELPSLLAAAEQRGAVILPVILRPCAHVLSRSPLARFEAVNSSPLSGKSDGERDRAFARLAKSIETSLGVVKT